jgi:lactoylglutathione lyase
MKWYGEVFGMKQIPTGSFNNTKVLLLTRGNFDLHFTPVRKEDWRRMAPSHFAMEVSDWDGFLNHLKSLNIRYTKPIERPVNRSKYCYIHDPDGNTVEIVYHADMHGAGQPG